MDDIIYELLKALDTQKQVEEFEDLLKGPHKYIRKIGTGKSTTYIYTQGSRKPPSKPIITTKTEREKIKRLNAKLDIVRNEGAIKEKIDQVFSAKSIKKGASNADIKKQLLSRIADSTTNFGQMEEVIDKISKDQSIFDFEKMLESKEVKNVKDYVTGDQAKALVESMVRWQPKLGTRSSGYGEGLLLFSVGGAKSAAKGDISVKGKYYELKANGGKLIGDSKFNKHGSAKRAEDNFSANLKKLGHESFKFNPETQSRGITKLNKVISNKEDKMALLQSYVEDIRPNIDKSEIKQNLDRFLNDGINKNNFMKSMAYMDFKKYQAIDKIDSVIMINQWNGDIMNIPSKEALLDFIENGKLEVSMEIRPGSSNVSAVQLDFPGAWGKKK